MHVAAIRLQVENRIADDLSGTVIRDVSSASGLVDVDAASRQRIGRGQDVRAAAVTANAEREDVGMFDEEQEIADAAVPALLDERAL